MAEVSDELEVRMPEKIVVARANDKQSINLNHTVKKRQPLCFPKRNKDIYVTNKTNFKAQLNKCEKLLDSGETELIIHGLGAAVNRACNLALQLRNNHCATLELDINTSTVNLIDDLQPLDDDGDYEIEREKEPSIILHFHSLCRPIIDVKTLKKMIFSLNELVHWLGLTIFEIWINLVSLTIFTVLLALKLDEHYFLGYSGWWIVFSPLFIADGLNTYFCAIIFMRMHMEGMIKVAILRALWSLISLLLVFVFKYLLCKKLSGQSSLEYSEVLSPVFILLQLVAVRACQLH